MLALLLATWLAADPLLVNGDFDDGLTGWRLQPGDAGQTAVEEADGRGKYLRLRPGGRLLGVETPPLTVGAALAPDVVYQVEAQIRNGGIEQGVFAFSMYCYDADGRSLKQHSFYSLSPKTATGDWRKVRGQFGPGTDKPLPDGTASVALRFSFYEAQGDCRGDVAIDAVALGPKPAIVPAGWPNEIVAEVAPLGVRFESRSFWTLYRIDFEGTRLCLDRWGSQYGSVANFPGVGFIGSGHTENEDELVEQAAFFVDGKQVDPPPAAVTAKRVRLEKRTRIRALALRSSIEVAEGRIVEDVRLTASRPTEVSLVYHFMHPWTFTATEFLAELTDGRRVEGRFNDDAGHKVDAPTRWSAIYDGPSGKGAVSVNLAVPDGDPSWRTFYWDQPKRYRKHYLATFSKGTIPAGKEFHYRMTTVPFAAGGERWKAEAERIARTASEHTK